MFDCVLQLGQQTHARAPHPTHPPPPHRPGHLHPRCEQQGVLPEGLPELTLSAKEPFTLTSFALSLLLVFRTNSRCVRVCVRVFCVCAQMRLRRWSLCDCERLGAQPHPLLLRRHTRHPQRERRPIPPTHPQRHAAPSHPPTHPPPNSYERWDGARKMWGLLLNRSRDFTRIVSRASGGGGLRVA